MSSNPFRIAPQQSACQSSRQRNPLDALLSIRWQRHGFEQLITSVMEMVNEQTY